MRKTESQKIALCGVLGALSVVLLLVGAALQIGTYAAPMLAAFLLIPVLDEYGPKCGASRSSCRCFWASPSSRSCWVNSRPLIPPRCRSA